MIHKWQFNLLTVLGALALLLVLGNATLFTLNRGAQNALSQQQQFIQQTVPLEGLYREIVKALAELALKSHDPQLLAILTEQGFSVTANEPASRPASAPAGKGRLEK